MKTGVWGNQVPPWSRETVMRVAHHARCNRLGSAGVPPAPRLRGHGAGPLPDSPPPGAGTRLLPPAGGGWEGGGTLRTMLTSDPHAAAPHNAAMNIRFFLGGLRPPKPSQGAGPGCAGLRPASAEGWGNPVSPHPSSRAYVHVSGGRLGGGGTLRTGESPRNSHVSRECGQLARGDAARASRPRSYARGLPQV